MMLLYTLLGLPTARQQELYHDVYIEMCLHDVRFTPSMAVQTVSSVHAALA